MILIFGGTTEGRQAARLFDVIEQPYFYSTKTETTQRVGGTVITGTMDANAIEEFCIKNSIMLIVDAAHPYAVELHQNIHDASIKCKIETLRFERPATVVSHSKYVRFFDDYASLEKALLESDFDKILALTGVQTIPKLRAVWENRQCCFRILDTPLSRGKVLNYGIPQHLVFPMAPDDKVEKIVILARETKAQVILSKESGPSGFIQSKVDAARMLNVPLWMVRRPSLPEFTYTVYSEKAFWQKFFELRKESLEEEGKLRSGYTTGSCATAAAKACFLTLFESSAPDRVTIGLPDGTEAAFPVFLETKAENLASFVVIKDAGDDPDVTHANEIGCQLKLKDTPGVVFKGGKGIGRVTLVGLQLPVGEPAINPVPRQMMTNLFEELSLNYEYDGGLEVTLFVPEGERLAVKTFNPRIGVVGGISVLGTSGRVHPFSNEAFMASVRHHVSVAKASGVQKVVLTSGKRSENIMRKEFPDLPDTAFIHFGNLVGETLQAVADADINEICLAVMFGKAVKLAEGKLNTHSKKARFNPTFLARIVRGCGYGESVSQTIESVKLANAVADIIPYSPEEPLYCAIKKKCERVCQDLLPEEIVFDFQLIVI
ncbi:cobalt-precorrin-5B (C(1))-methyltransferase [Marinilabilia rubra]|uniref:Cobalt-precorrin-5B C(1)-methyltransferase n=1 Tax=Marinilabilia rubra TaxID=2162893 RepID=A0A2U2B5R2_9BACT|nr:cobalt-precorrin-5B (C(1))-methyltransferase [Marinilabilia rubra]PWD98407.1 precorrin-6x reductase [Marinilabilia rubra]